MKKLISILAAVFILNTSFGQIVNPAWSLKGNKVTSANKFGSTNAADVKFVSNNTERMRIESGGNIYSYGKGSINTNQAFGRLSLNSNTTGSNNSSYGLSTLQANTTGADNTAMGSGAMVTNTTGGLNCAFGVSALALNLSGTQNVGIGVSALVNNSTASYNTAVGYSALQATTVDGNTAMGHRAMFTTSTGGDNAAFGADALYTNTTGNNNAAFGRYSGFSNVGSRNIFIGYAAGFRQTVASDRLFISPYLYADAATEESSALIVGTFNLTPASQVLQVNGKINAMQDIEWDGSGFSKMGVGGSYDFTGTFAGGFTFKTTANNILSGTWDAVNSKSIVNLNSIPSYADNAAAVAGGLVVGDLYHTAGTVKIVIP